MKIKKIVAGMVAGIMAASMMSMGASAAVTLSSNSTYGFGQEWEKCREYKYAGTVVAHLVYGYKIDEGIFSDDYYDFAWTKSSTSKNRAIVHNNSDYASGSLMNASSSSWSKASIDHSGGNVYSIYLAGYSNTNYFTWTQQDSTYNI